MSIRRSVVLRMLLVAAGLLAAGTGSAIAASGNPRLELPNSGLENPYRTPIFLLGQVGLGFGGVVDGVRPCGGATFVMRPGNAERFLPVLQEWNTSMVLQAEYQKVNDTQRILSGDLFLRRYLGDVQADEHGPVFFVGPGVGASEVVLPSGKMEKGFEWLAEAGQEWRPARNRLLAWKLQYRWYDYHGRDFSHWSLQIAAGLPWPF